MKIAFIATNYNNTFHTENLVRSFEKANQGTDKSQMIIVDNASGEIERERLVALDAAFPWVHVIYNADNIGYFKGLNVGLEYIEKKFDDFDFVIVGNNDLLVPPNFISSFEQHSEVLSQHYVTCPNIVSADGYAQNPHVVKGFSKARWFIWRLYYFSFQISRLILWVATLLGELGKRKDTQAHEYAQEVATGYGACYILNREFRANGRRLFMPTFLMHEEYFLSYQLKKLGQRPFYLPEIRVDHVEHAAVKTVPKRTLWEYELASYKMMRKLEKTAQIFS